jgi:hypothetical protein
MAATSLLARLGLRLATLGSAASLAIAAPLAEGDVSQAAHTDASRIGLHFNRTPGDERITFSVMGVDRAYLNPNSMYLRGFLTADNQLDGLDIQSDRFSAAFKVLENSSVGVGRQVTLPANSGAGTVAVGNVVTLVGVASPATRNVCIGADISMAISTGGRNVLVGAASGVTGASGMLVFAVNRTGIQGNNGIGIVNGGASTINLQSGILIGSATGQVGNFGQTHVIGIGVGVTCSAGFGIAIGNGASSAHSKSIAFGRNAATTAANQLRIGGTVAGTDQLNVSLTSDTEATIAGAGSISTAGGIYATKSVFGAIIAGGDGTVAAPSLSFLNSLGTGFFRPAADTISISTAGVERTRVWSDGGVQIGGAYATSPGDGCLTLPDNVGNVTRLNVRGRAQFISAANTDPIAFFGHPGFQGIRWAGTSEGVLLESTSDVATGPTAGGTFINFFCNSTVANMGMDIGRGIDRTSRLSRASAGGWALNAFTAIGRDVGTTITNQTLLRVANRNPTASLALTGGAFYFQIADYDTTLVAETTILNVDSGRNLNTAFDAFISTVRVGLGGGAVATNTCVGASAMAAVATGANNVAVGNLALNALGGGNFNIAVGVAALNKVTNAARNIGIGYQALNDNLTSNDNIAIGYQALAVMTTGGGNVAIGTLALNDAVNSFNSTAVGMNAFENATGSNNTGLGNQAGRGTVAGASNIAIGSSSLIQNTTGSSNVAIGHDAGSGGGFISNNQCTFIGRSASSEVNGLTNATALGNNAIVQASNTVQLGSTSVVLVRVANEGNNCNSRIETYGSTAVPGIQTFRARGTAAAPTAVQTNDNLGFFGGYGWGTAFSSTSRAKIEFKAAETWTGAAQGTYLSLFTTPIGSTTIAERLRIYDDGGVAIGGSYGGSFGAGSLRANGLVIAADRLYVYTTNTAALQAIFTWNGGAAATELPNIWANSTIQALTGNQTGTVGLASIRTEHDTNSALTSAVTITGLAGWYEKSNLGFALGGGGSLAITNYYGGYVANMPALAAGVTITNQYGLYIEAPTRGTFNASIRALGLVMFEAAENHAITRVNVDTNLGVTHCTIEVDASGGAVNINLPDSTGTGVNGRLYNIVKVDASANPVNINRAGADTINGATTIALTVQYQSRTVQARAATPGYSII